MAERTFASLVSKVSASVPGCPQPTIVQYVRDAAIRTCERTLAWRYQIPLYNLLPGVFEYEYNKPAGTDVHAVFKALLNDVPMDLLTLEQAIAAYPTWADLFSGESVASVWSGAPSSTFNAAQYNEALYNDNGEFILPDSATADGSQPQSLTQLTPDKYIVLPLPDDENPYQMRMFVALKPKRTATGMDEVIFDDLEDSIIHNTLQHLLVLPNSHWSDRELASYHAKQFLFTVTERRARANIGNMRSMVRTTMQPFGA